MDTTENLTTSPAPEHQVRRPGIKSSEGVLTAIVVSLPILLPVIYSVAEVLKTSLPATSPYLLPVTIIAAAIAASGYARSRGDVKASRNLASSGPSTVAAGGDVNMSATPEVQPSHEVDLALDETALSLQQPTPEPINENIEVIDDANDSPQGS